MANLKRVTDLVTEPITSDYHKVPSFANNTARDAAIPNPVVGMLIFNADSGAVQQYNGVWSTIAPAPNITSCSGFLNEDNDATITAHGSNFTASSVLKMYDAASGGNQIGADGTTTFVSSTNIKAVFGAGAIPAAGTAVYIEVDNVGATSRFSTAITVNADPTVTHAGATGANADTTDHLGTYGGISPHGPHYPTIVELWEFDQAGGGSNLKGSTDFEDTTDQGHGGAPTGNYAGTRIKGNPFGDGKTAIYFDGTNDWISCGNGPEYEMDGDFTIELWFMSSFGNGNSTVLIGNGDHGGANGWLMGFNGGSDNTYVVKTWDYGTSGIGHFDYTGYGIRADTWTHIAICRKGAVVRGFLNGDMRYQATHNTNTFGNGSDAANHDLRIGSDRAGGYDFIGWMDEIRVVKGEALFTKSFVPSKVRYGTAGATHEAATAANVKLLVHSNLSSTATTFTDSAPTPHFSNASQNGQVKHSTLWNVAESTVVPPFAPFTGNGKTYGSIGAYFKGSGSAIQYDGAEGAAKALDAFTMDFWIYPTDNGTERSIFQYGNWGTEGGQVIHIQRLAGQTIKSSLYINGHNDSQGNGAAYTSTLTAPVNTWTHYAMSRGASSTQVLHYVNGRYDGAQTMTSTGVMRSSGADQVLGAGYQGGGTGFLGYIDLFRLARSALYTGTTASDWGNFDEITAIGGVDKPSTIPTITLTGVASAGLASDEDIEFTSVANSSKGSGVQHLTDTGIGLVLTNLTGGNKSKATLTGNIDASAANTTHTNMPIKAQVRKTLGDAAYANASRTVTFSGSTTTAGLSPAMPVSGTGIPAATTITSVDTATTITLSANPTGGTLTGQELIFLDLTRITHPNGSDILNNANGMYSIVRGASGSPTLFASRRYMGNEQIRTISRFGFAPDLIWIKQRTGTGSHVLFDTVRGATQQLKTDSTTTQTAQAGKLTHFTNDGCGLGIDTNVNKYSAPWTDLHYVAWAWKAGGKPSGILAAASQAAFGAGSDYVGATVGAGTIANNSTGVSNATSISQSVSQTSGFSITKFTGHSSGVTIPHHLGGTPAMIIMKNMTSGYGWEVWHQNLTAPAQYYMRLDTTAAEANAGDRYSTAPSPTIITGGSGGGTGGLASNNYICYAWKAVAGVSAFGKYTGTSGGNRVYTSTDGTSGGSGSFRPKFILTKSYTNTSNYTGWTMWDASRSFNTPQDNGTGSVSLSGTTYPTAMHVLYANDQKVENQRAGNTGASNCLLTVYENGFQFTQSQDETNSNAGWQYIYMALA